MDELNQKMLDRIALRHNLFLQFHGRDSGEIVIIPVEIETNFLAGLRQGIGSRFGPTQEIAAEWLHPFKVEMKEC